MLTSRSQTIRRRLGSVTLTGQELGLGLGVRVCFLSATRRSKVYHGNLPVA